VKPDRVAEEEEVARVYAKALLKRDHPTWFWPDMNRAIIERWSVTALRRVKNRAWEIATRGERR
jgi:hypothetical protein